MLEIIPQSHYLASLAILVSSILLARIVHYVLDRHVRRFTQKTATKVDDSLLDALLFPSFVIIILTGLFLSAMTLPFLIPYSKYLAELSFVSGVLAVAWILQRVITQVVPAWLKVGKSFEKTPRLLSRIINGAFYFIAAMIILGHYGVEITPLVTTLGIGGIAVGLALQDTLSNFFAGLYIISEKPVNIGDYIEIEPSVSGYIEDIGWRTTKIQTLSNNIILFPNSKLAQSIIVNVSFPNKEMGITIPFTVSFESNLDKVERVSLETARFVQKHAKGAVQDFEPSIRFTSFGDSSIHLTVGLRIEKFEHKGLIVSILISELKKRFEREGIQFGTPTRRIISEK